MDGATGRQPLTCSVTSLYQRLAQGRTNARKAGLKILEDLMIMKAKHPKAPSLKLDIAASIQGQTARMIGSVNLDNQLDAWSEEISDKRSCRHLPPKVVAWRVTQKRCAPASFPAEAHRERGPPQRRQRILPIQVPITPPSSFVMTMVEERGRPPVAPSGQEL